jgi:hypothetical protein
MSGHLVRAEIESLLEYATGAESYFNEAIQDVACSLRTSHEAARVKPSDPTGSFL